MKSERRDRFHVIRWVIWGLAAIFYLYEYLLRISPSVMVEELAHAFAVDAAALGVLSAFYFYIYAPMQIPVGLLMDKYGARKLLTIASFTCGLGGLLFGLAPALWLADVGRVLTGFGSSFAFVGICYVSAAYFPPTRTAMLIGLGNSFGMLGAIIAEAPLAISVDTFGWRPTSIAFGIFGIVLALVILWIIRGAPPRKKLLQDQGVKPIGVWKSLYLVCRNYQTWINGLIALCIYSVTSVLAGLWGLPFLQAAHGFSKEMAGLAVSMIFIGWLAGGPVIGHLSDWAGRRRPFLMLGCFGTLIVLSPVIYLPSLDTAWVFILLFFTGFFSGGQLLNFAVAIETNDPRSKAMSAALTNGLIALGASFFQPFIGFLLDLGKKANGGPLLSATYSIEEYQLALTTFPVLLIIGFILCFFIRETRPFDQLHNNAANH